MNRPREARPHLPVVMTDDPGQCAAGCYGNGPMLIPTLDYGCRFCRRRARSSASASRDTPVVRVLGGATGG